VRDWSERRLAGLVGTEEQGHGAVAEQHRLNRQRGVGALFVERRVIEIPFLRMARDFRESRSTLRSSAEQHKECALQT